MATADRAGKNNPYHSPASKSPSGGGASRGAMLALTAALLGWLFDGFEMGLFSLVGRSAIQDLIGVVPGTAPTAAQEAATGQYFGIVIALFLVGAATGGVVFGWLGDRIGRVRAMSLSVLTYALFTGMCGLVSSTWMIGGLRFVASLGMGGEWSLGVALVMEIWPNRSRAFLAGLIGAAANVGYLLTGFMGLVLVNLLGSIQGLLGKVGFSPETVEWLTRFQGWRLLMIAGALPALLTFFIRLFVPESKKWQAEQAGGHTSNWATVDLLGVLIGATGPALIIFVWASDSVSLPLQIVGTIVGVVIATCGYMYPVVRYLRRTSATAHLTKADQTQTLRRMLLGACLSGVALLATWGSAQWAPFWADQLRQTAKAEALAQPGADKTAINKTQPAAKEWTQIWLAIGAVIGTILAALACDRFGRRATYAMICLISLASIWLLYLGNRSYGTGYLASSLFVGICTAAFYGWLPLYLPELFRTAVRATGQGFSFNFGRILAAIGALQAGNLVSFFKDGKPIELPLLGPYNACPAACSIMALVYLVGLVVIFFSPETKGQPLPD
ncbi:MAG: MFS transporter [Pirellulales bacterium]